MLDADLAEDDASQEESLEVSEPRLIEGSEGDLSGRPVEVALAFVLLN